ncbi:MAG: hypothetical protein ACLFRX_04860 [Gemmatimonadota bacterium]
MRRQIEVAAATAWEALVEVHAGHALRFVGMMAAHLDFEQAVERYLDELDVREPMVAAIRARVLVALEHALGEHPDRPDLGVYGHAVTGDRGDREKAEQGLRRFRPDVLMKGVARKVREAETMEEWVALAVARAEEGVIRAHVDNAVVFAALLRRHVGLADAVDDYLERMRVSGGRAQSVHQRSMARLADLHLPALDGSGGAPGGGDAAKTRPAVDRSGGAG